MSRILSLSLCALSSLSCLAQESFPPLKDGKIPENLEELWDAYDPRAEPLEVEQTKEWEQDGIICRVVRYKVGVFKGAPARVAAIYAFPKGATKLPALLQIHGGGQSASLDSAVTSAKLGYVGLSLNWGGNKINLGKDGVYTGPNTDWGNLDATHPPQRNKTNHFAGGISPDEFTLDPVVSPRNDNWFLVVIAARRALTFLEQQPEVDPDKLGVYGHSMGGRLTTEVTGIDKRVKVAVPSCGGSGDVPESQTDLPGGRKGTRSAVEMACVSENPYIEKLAVPTLWLSPTNDFHAHIDNMAFTWRNVPNALLGLSISPHFNHRHTNENALTQHLWFEQYLKGAVQLPKTPQLVLNLKTPTGIPELIVTPDTSMPIKGVDIYYSTDPHGLTRFWRDAVAKQDGLLWKADAPIRTLDEPIFAFANVLYETPAQYQHIPHTPGSADSAVFALSTREGYATAEQLKASNVQATEKVERVIDDGARGWHDWCSFNWGHSTLWTVLTRKVKDAKWRGPDGARLVFEVNPRADASLVVKVSTNEWGAFPGKPKGEYYVIKPLKGAPDYQSVSVGLEELMSTDSQVTTALTDWQTVTDLSFSPSITVLKDGQKFAIEGKHWKDPTAIKIRNLRWEGGQYPATQLKSAVLDENAHRENFNNAIKKSLEQEKLDKK
jgi:hypothetical protein